MIIDLSEVMKDYGGRVQISGDVFMEDVPFLGETFSSAHLCILKAVLRIIQNHWN